MKEPKLRFGTKETIKILAQELKLPYDDSMQDWPYQVADPEDVEKYIAHYELISDEDMKFVLMEIIIQSVNDQNNERDFLKYWDRIEEILNRDFIIHKYTIFYWSRFDRESIEEEWTISSNMRGIWNNHISVQ